MESPSEERREFIASYQQYKDFLQSSLWTDLQGEIQAWIDDIHGYLESETDIQEVYRFQGRLQSCRQLLALPERILANMEMAHESVEATEEVVPLDLADTDVYYQEQLQRWTEEDLEDG